MICITFTMVYGRLGGMGVMPRARQVEDQMQCAAHGADGCAECTPGMRAAWTVGELKTALAAIPDGTALAVNVAGPSAPHVAGEQVIAGGGFGTIDWGDGSGPQIGPVFGLECEIPENLLLRPRPAQAAVPVAGVPVGFRIETTTVDDRPRALFYCASCAQRPRGGGRIGDLFRSADLAALASAAREHICPPEVSR
jgi:hypothetical protein